MSSRKSVVELPDDPDLILTDASQIAEQEARNGLLQFDEVNRLTNIHAVECRIGISPQLICNLNKIAINGIRYSAGNFRLIPIKITHTSHQPPPPDDIPRHMEDMCEYVDKCWNTVEDTVTTALHISSYLMWRLNWIHPFRDGNGRTSRAVSYLALGVGLGRELIGTPTIADQIVDNKLPYYRALDEADAAWKLGIVKVEAMEVLLEEMLSRQLSS